jgi:hypothetical protein
MRVDVGEAVLYGSIWASIVAWTAAECLRLSRRGPTPMSTARRLWAAGAACAAVHVTLAFHLRHAWSHASAVAETARQTDELVGFRFGGGVWVNYAFLAVWTADALWWGLSPASFARRPPALDAAVRLFLLFIVVNGAIVFAHGPVRVLGASSLAALAVAWHMGRGG